MRTLFRNTRVLWREFPLETSATIIVGYLTGVFTLVVVMYVISRY